MGEALGNSLFYGIALLFGLGLLGFIALVTGLVGIFVHGAAKAVLLGISAVCGLPVIGFILYNALDIEYLIEDFNYKTENSALVLAVEDCDLAKVQKLLKKKKNPNELKNGRSPLITAFNRKNNKNVETSDKIIELLLQYGADVNLGAEKGPDDNITTPGYNYSEWNTFPLKCAIDAKRLNAAKMIVKKGANINSIKTEKIREYLDKGVKEEDIPYEDKIYSFRPVQYAIEENSFECAKYFLDEGANFTISFGGYRTCFMTLMSKNYIKENDIIIEIFEKLLENFSESEKIELLNRKDESGKTALHYFAVDCRFSENTKLLLKLLEYEIKMNEADKDGKTPLHYAVHSYSDSSDYLEVIYPVVQLLIKNGADKNCKDKKGNFPVDIFRDSFEEKDNETWKKIEKLLLPDSVSKNVKETASKETYSIKTVAFNEHTLLSDPAEYW